VTGVVDRLERDGLVARDPAAEDLRAKEVRLTSKGRRLVEQVLAGHSGQIAELMSGLKSAEQADLMRLLERLSSHLEIVADRVERGEDSAAARAG
jgi:DNA-binding MarR family transcriptional regulator